MNHLISSKFYHRINPVGAVRQTQADRWKKRPSVLRYRAFAGELRMAAAAQNFVLGERCIMIFQIQMADSWSKKKKELMNGKPHQQKPDWDNLAKSVGDILGVNQEDSYIHTAFCAKFWAYEGSVRVYNIHQTVNSDLMSLVDTIESDLYSQSSSALQKRF